MTKPRTSTVFRFVILIGVVNLFADLTYEGARSITGPFLAQLGATAAIISIVSGAGEFLGYSLRAVAGYVADKTGGYWALTFVGYAINLLAVPALALAGSWPAAACLMAAERTGRAIRRPIVQGMLSHAKEQVGGGRAFGLNESLDALGATIGPLVVALVIAWRGDYRLGFAVLLGSALVSLGLLVVVRRRYPNPQAFERATRWQSTRVGFPVLIGAFVLGALFTPLVFFGPAAFAWVGMALWGISKGAQDTLLKPAIAPLIAPSRRTSAFGILDACFGTAWLAGSIAFGLLYDKFLPWLVTLSVVGHVAVVAAVFHRSNGDADDVPMSRMADDFRDMRASAGFQRLGLHGVEVRPNTRLRTRTATPSTPSVRQALSRLT